MGNGIEHIVSLYNASWYGWTLLLLGICAVLSEVFQPGVMTGITGTVFARSERMYKRTPDNFPGQLSSTIFQIGTLALMLVMIWRDRFDSAANGIALYGIAAAMIVAVLLVKTALNGLIDYTFQLKASAEVSTHMAGITMLVCLGLYAAALVLPLAHSVVVNRWVAGALGIVYLALTTYRMVLVFMSGAKSILYILMYVMTLEVLPIGVLVAGISQMMQII
ncbi:MAG: DUF4271 domain-containing protein [Paludibacteraceae bacterium]|nr:DUF4271 domain-containing protein [Paludibacteraceae bacterium]